MSKNCYELWDIQIWVPNYQFCRPEFGLSEQARKLKSAIPRFCVEGLPKILDFGYFVLIWQQTGKKTRNPEAELQGPVYLDMTANCLIADNIFNIEANGALAMHVIVHNSLTQNQNRLKFWI